MDDLELAKLAANGDEICQKKINSIAHPIISYQTQKLCRLYCHQLHQHYSCTLVENPKPAPRNSDAPLCEWGNASYGWMLNELVRPSRLQNYQAKNNASLVDYFFVIANSFSFKERWKNWRLVNNVHVPVCIQRISKSAIRVFYGLYNGNSIDKIASDCKLNLKETEDLIDLVTLVLTQQGKLNSLNKNALVSLTNLNSEIDSDTEDYHSLQEADIPIYDIDQAKKEDWLKIEKAWKQLTGTEQFILQSMVVEKESAENVLEVINTLGLSLQSGMQPKENDIQQLYYFRRKTLKKLAKLSGIGESGK